MASGGLEEPFSKLALAVFDESSPVSTQKGSAHSCSNFGGKIQKGVPASQLVTGKDYLSHIFV